jgi:hypothetical protein
LFYSTQDNNLHLSYKKMGVGLDFAVAVFFLFLALGTKVRPWLPIGPLKDKRRILSAVPAPVPIINATSFNIINQPIHPPRLCLLIRHRSAKAFPSDPAVSKLTKIPFKSKANKYSKRKGKLHCRGHRYNQVERE